MSAPEISNIKTHIRVCLKKIPSKGRPDIDNLVAHLAKTRGMLRRLVSRYRKEYCYQALTLTLRTSGEDRRNPDQYRGLVIALKNGFRFLWNHGALRAPGAGAVANVHLQGNVNLHALYWGPMVDLDQLISEWEDITGGSHEVDVQQLRSSQDVERWVAYIAGYPRRVKPADLVRYWLAVRGLVLLTYFGVMRSPRNRLRKVVTKRGAKSDEILVKHTKEENCFEP